MRGPQSVTRSGTPGKGALWRDARFVRIALQVLFLCLVIAAAGVLYANVTRGLNRLGLDVDFGFLQNEAGFGISEGIAYELSDTYARAVIVGIGNTIRVSLVGIVLATLIGLLVGLARLSGNWLVRKLGGFYVEVFRNTPLLLQLMFWYTAVILKLPAVRQSINLYDTIFINQRGVYLPEPYASAGFSTFQWFMFASCVAAGVVYALRLRYLKRVDRPGFPFLWALGAFLFLVTVSWVVTPESPVAFEVPRLQGFNFQGGILLSPEFAALLLGLSTYTGAFIAEVVRGGVQSVAKGQREAAAAVGLKPAQATYLIILPQALRTIVPPLTSQYLNLFKNSSLAIAVGFPDLFSIGQTILNQTGQSIPVFVMIMIAYLAMSLITSVFMNWYNHRIRLIER